jgi:hypothetical protein
MSYVTLNKMKPQSVIFVLQTFLLILCHCNETQKLWLFVSNIKNSKYVDLKCFYHAALLVN